MELARDNEIANQSLITGSTLREHLVAAMSADAVVVMPGWQGDEKAHLIASTAQRAGLPLLVLEGGQLRPRITVVGISGYGQSGKDTIGSTLVAHGYVRDAFADRIREGLYRLDPLLEDGRRVTQLVDELGWEKAKTSTPEVRALLQRLGVDMGRGILGDNVWVDLTLNRVPDGARLVITDCRFPNEAEAVKRLGGTMWRVWRPGYEPVNSHYSEVALDDWVFDRRFENTGTMADLAVQVEAAIVEDGLV